jgi:hypothetical protein
MVVVERHASNEAVFFERGFGLNQEFQHRCTFVVLFWTRPQVSAVIYQQVSSDVLFEE